MEKAFLSSICSELKLGELTEEPKRLSGGFLHKMYSLFTDKGKYAVKLLNPFIMQRETALGNFCTAEHFEAILEKSDIPILPALTFGGKKMQQYSGRYFYVFEWFPGKALKPEEITAVHAEKIGRTLAFIHAQEKCENFAAADTLKINWQSYTERLLEAEPQLGALLWQNQTFLDKLQTAANAAVKKLPPVNAICHNDMDPKNVLWFGDEHRVIDLECLGYGHPGIELIETALCWSGLDDCRIDPKLFCTFIRAYKQAGGEISDDLNVLFDANSGRLGWLEYCIQRTLGINCSEEERNMGAAGMKTTLLQLQAIGESRNMLLAALLDQGIINS